MGNKKKMLEGFQSAMGAKYDSDEDLTKEEREQIEQSYNPDKTRKNIWKKKGTWDKTKRMMKSAWYGDKQKKEEE